MSTVEKAYDYYHKIVNLKKDAKTDKLTLINIKDMIETLSSVIDNGNDYLLTDATMYFIASQVDAEDMIKLVKSLNNKDESICFINEFLNSIPLSLYDYYFKHMNQYEKEYYNFILKNILHNHILTANQSFEDGYLLVNICLLLVSMAIVDRKDIERFSKEFNEYISDANNKIDEILMQGICHEDPKPYTARDTYSFDVMQLIHFMYNKLNDEKREIR